MDKKKFKDFIESVAVIKDQKPVTTGFRLDENSGGEVRYEGEWVELSKDTNPTLGFKFVKLKEVDKLCELGCGKIVPNQVIERRLGTYPEKHWKTRCQSCGRYPTPDGKSFVKSTEIQSEYMKFFNKEKIKIDPRVIKMAETNQEYEEETTNDTIIRKYK